MQANIEDPFRYDHIDWVSTLLKDLNNSDVSYFNQIKMGAISFHSKYYPKSSGCSAYLIFHQNLCIDYFQGLSSHSRIPSPAEKNVFLMECLFAGNRSCLYSFRIIYYYNFKYYI